MLRLLCCLGLAFTALPYLSVCRADEPYDPPIAEASNEGELAKEGFRVPERMTTTLVAAEPMIANPVAFTIDEQGRFYVCETFRQQKGVEDNRNHGNWLETDLSLETVEDRAAMFKKFLPDQGKSYTVEHDRIRLLTDTDGDDRVDESVVFADGFNDLLDGTGAGVLTYRNDVWYTCIPALYRLRDTDGDLTADERKVLHYGYGVRVAFRGHDMHGLVWGPDGKLYYSIGDRGYTLETEDGEFFSRPDTGAVFRCNPDGSQLEVFAYGLRNPQELAFDDYGNLFTGDNNSDSGDKARWVHVVEGSDSGWRMYFQYLSDRGPWNREKLWHPRHDGQAAYIVPPVANLGDGPSGLTYYPGVGLPERYRGHFFMADFRGTPGRSGIRSFAVEPVGAHYRLVDSHEFIWQTLATDVEFGYDGAIYATDWVNGWNGLGKGRLYRFADQDAIKSTYAGESAELLEAGLENLSKERLAELLGHADRRIRLFAQFELANRGAVRPLLMTAKEGTGFARLHGVWGIGQLLGEKRALASRLFSLADDDDPHVRAQVLRVLGDNRIELADDLLRKGLTDKDARVRMYAAIGLGRIGVPTAVEDLQLMLANNADADPVLRHAAVMGLTGSASANELVDLRTSPTPRIRLGAVLALRRIGSPRIAAFLNDSDPQVALAAARGIHDEPIPSAFPQLAALAGRAGMSAPLLRRVMNANFRIGGPDHARNVAAMAADRSLDDPLRLEALEQLSLWNEPPKLDRVLGDYRPLADRQPVELAGIVRPAIGGMLQGSDAVRTRSIQLAAQYGISDIGPELVELFAETSRPTAVRVAALEALDAIRFAKIDDAIQRTLIEEKNPAVRATALLLLAKSRPGEAVDAISRAFKTGSVIEKQAAVRSLEYLGDDATEVLLIAWMNELLAGRVAPEVQLDILEAARSKDDPRFREKTAAFEATRPANTIGPWIESLAGGDADRGREIFFGRTAVSCRRCHQVGGSGGEVGPDLSVIGKTKTREYLLEAIVAPNAQIAKGFDTLVIATFEGKVISGIIKNEDETQITLLTANGDLVTVLKDEIDEQAKGKSSMPSDLVKSLSRADIRDLVEYLSTLKTPIDAEGGHGE